MERTTSFGGDSNIGVFARVFEDIAIIPPEAPEQFRALLADALDVDLVITTVQGSPIIGSLVAGNSKALVVSGLATDREIDLLEEYRPVLLLEHTMNAAGNIILANDQFAAVHPDMPADLAEEVGDALGVTVSRLTLAGIKTVGMAGVATNRGVVVHPRSTNQEIERLEKLAGLTVGTGSVNMGSGLVGTGLLGNSRGYIAGTQTSGFELGRVEDIFGFLE